MLLRIGNAEAVVNDVEERRSRKRHVRPSVVGANVENRFVLPGFESGAKRGVFALQLHAGGPTEVRVKDLKLEVEPQRQSPAAK